MHRAIAVLAASALLAPHARCTLTVILARHFEVDQAASNPAPSTQGCLRSELLASPQRIDGRKGAIVNDRSPVMQISFVRSGGFPGALRNVKATVNLKSDQPDVSSDSAYHRVLAPDEAEQLRTAADPAGLAQAARKIATRTSRSADLDHYHITVTTKDGKTYDVDLNTSGSSKELQDVPPAAAKLLRWLQEESQKILANRVKGG